MAAAHERSVLSAISNECRTVLPREVRERLQVSPGDQLRYIIDDNGVRLEKAVGDVPSDPFASFSEWSSPEDEKAFGKL